MSNLEIIKAMPSDVILLQKISRKTFAETFALQNTTTDMQKYLESNLSTEVLTNEIINPESEFYFVKYKHVAIGYLKINIGNAQTELKFDNAVEIERIYVLKDYQGLKAGNALLNKAIGIARHRNAEWLWLGVWEKNTNAISFYKKYGFVTFDKHIFKLGDDMQTDILMHLKLLY